MKKFLSISLMLLAVMAMTVSFAGITSACGEEKTDATTAAAKSCGGDKAKATTASSKSCGADKAKATTASSKSCGSKGTSATTASAKTCTPEEMAACAKAMGMTVEECAKMWADGKFSRQTISIKGMTCGSCENSVKAALMKIDGVNNVVSVSHKDEKAVVCIDNSKCNSETLIKTVTDKGYKAEIILAVATTTATTADASKSACAKACASKTAAEKAACGSKDKKDSKAEGTL